MEGILLVDKQEGKNSFSLISLLRRLTNIKKIGHTGTLDPFASGLMVLLIGRNYTKKSNLLLCQDKEYEATICLGAKSNTFDREGIITLISDRHPTLKEIEDVLNAFQGEIWQTPPMFSAKKMNGQKLYNLARKGLEIERKKEKVKLAIKLISYDYPYLNLHITCSKGTYIRALANDMGEMLQIGGYLTKLKRTRSGNFLLQDAIAQIAITSLDDIKSKIMSHENSI